jgi:hypothetical protein
VRTINQTPTHPKNSKTTDRSAHCQASEMKLGMPSILDGGITPVDPLVFGFWYVAYIFFDRLLPQQKWSTSYSENTSSLISVLISHFDQTGRCRRTSVPKSAIKLSSLGIVDWIARAIMGTKNRSELGFLKLSMMAFVKERICSSQVSFGILITNQSMCKESFRMVLPVVTIYRPFLTNYFKAFRPWNVH